jgi:hypothetical protein
LCNPKPICFKLLTHCVRRAASRAACTAGRSRAIKAVRQDLAPPRLLAPLVGDQAAGDLPDPHPEVAAAVEFIELLQGDDQGLLREVVDRLGPHPQRADERAQARLLRLHPLQEPTGPRESARVRLQRMTAVNFRWHRVRCMRPRCPRSDVFPGDTEAGSSPSFRVRDVLRPMLLGAPGRLFHDFDLSQLVTNLSPNSSPTL